MAIGKVNAFASVTAPQVDFGSVALNAQKFQQAADDEKLKLQISLKAKKDKEKYESMNVNLGATGLSKLDQWGSQKLKSFLDRYAPVAGTAEGEAIKNEALLFVSQFKKMGDSIKSYDKEATSVSDASSSFTEAFGSLVSNNFDIEEVNGQLVFKPYKTRSDGKIELDENNQPRLIEITNSFGETTPYLTQDDINNYQTRVIKKQSLIGEDGKPGIVQKIASSVGDIFQVRENGSITVSKNFLDKEDVTTIEDTSRALLIEDRARMADLAKTLLPKDERFSKPKKEYTNQEYDDVTKALSDKVMQVYKLKSSVTEDKSGSGRSVKPGEQPLELNIDGPIQGTQTFSWTSPNSKRTQVNDFGSFELSINNTDQKQSSLQSIGVFTNKDKKAGSTEYFYIKVANRSSSSSGTGSGTARMGVGEGELTQQTILFTGSAENKALIQNYATKILNPKTGKYFKSAQDLFDYVKEQKKKFSGTQR